MKLLLAILGVALLIGGEVLAFYVYSSYTQGGFVNGFLGITAAIAIFFGNILMLIPYLEYFVKNEAFLKSKGKGVFFFAGSVFFILGITPFVLSIVTFYHFTGEYHSE